MERLSGKMPSAQEATRLLQAENLSPLEEQLLPLCRVSDVERRLTVVVFAKMHSNLLHSMLSEFAALEAAAEQACKSRCLQAVHTCALGVANIVNHGQVNGAVDFPLSSFSSFANHSVDGGDKNLHHLTYHLMTQQQKPDADGMLNFIDKFVEGLPEVLQIARKDVTHFSKVRS